MDAWRAGLPANGYQVSWASRTVSGYPFRLDITLQGVTVRAPSGWSVAAPVLKGEAFAWAPDHWVAVAPEGLVYTRRDGGVVTMKAKALRASLSEFGAHPPRLSVEGIGLTFTTPPGTKPYFMTSAGEFHLHTRAGPGDQGAAYVELDNARAHFTGLIGLLADGAPVTLIGDGIYSHASALRGGDWVSAVQTWSRAGGAIKLRRLQITGPMNQLDAHAGVLTVGDDGRLRGSFTAHEAACVPCIAAFSTGVTVDFRPGQSTLRSVLGTVSIGRPPKIY